MPVAPPSVVPPKPAHTMSSSQSMAEYYQKSAQYAPVEVSQDRDDDTSHRSAATSMLFRLCLYGFFIELKPSEAYLNTFLTSEKAHVLGFSNQVTNDDIYPWFTYGQMLMLVAMPLFVERFQYRTVLLIESVGFLFTRLLLLWATSLFWMQVTYAVGTASKVVYLCMIYREVKQEEYHRATAVVWAASLGGQFAAGVLGQILVSFHASLWLLNYISLANVCVAFVVALYVPEHADLLLSTTSAATPATFSSHHPPSSNQAIQARRLKRARLAERARTWRWTNVLAVSWIAFKCCESLVVNYIQNQWTSFHGIVERSLDGQITHHDYCD
ncbi:hypothetical protein DYB28_001124 [Aphanomyces astaci]|uniref:Major facilitator superfamily (MFS) profile domain-containing protein n=1 Tax=Aphanomyces astaci TaxID=112090 RepID=A0A397APL4_APHAT|nr:hypothetical protein DYB25_004965 [Aphanomyces astaci]RHY57992.1 hypothetical protein DYB38_000305 [Aphanomyces astaci]RHY58441.1 hypothetical protein DYB30_001932 [Aphanomyces astaci]RHY69265.1 hypothetical protein DYB34_004521 [Aphanomyces astaci]RLO12925.1 hypothetical protein DYB28_001124 [Aphanomyces astaci]